MQYTRRDFLAAASGAAGSVLVARYALARPRWSVARADDRYFRWKRARDGSTDPIWVGFDDKAGNSMVVVGKGESVLVDCKTPAFGAVLRREANLIDSGSPVTTVINTHHHADHTGGNHAMRGAAAAGGPNMRIIAHVKCKERAGAAPNMERFRQQADAAVRDLAKSTREAAKAVLKEAQALAERFEKGDVKGAEFEPTETIAKDTQIEVGGVKVTLRHVGPGHTDNDVFVVLPQWNVVHTGDLLFYRLHPFIDRPAGAATLGWMESVRQIIAACDAKTVVVAGHGELTDREGLKGQIAYFEKVREVVGNAIKDGKDRAETAAIEIPEFKDYDFPQVRAATMASVWDEIKENK